MRHLLLSGLTLLLLTSAAHAEPVHATAELIADAKTVEPGGTLTVGLRMTMTPKWHVYWLNAGDSGMSTSFELTAPEGWEVGPVQWPTPSKFFDGTFTTYGYEHEVLLMRTVSVPTDAKAGATVTLQAKAEWLVCDHEACIAGDAEPSVTIAVGAKREPAHAELFVTWRGRVPASGKDAPRPFDTLIGLASAKTIKPDSPVGIGVQWKEPVTGVDWYPAATEAMLIEDVKVMTDGKLTTIQYKVTELQPEHEPIHSVPGVLVWTDEAGVRHSRNYAGPGARRVDRRE